MFQTNPYFSGSSGPVSSDWLPLALLAVLGLMLPLLIRGVTRSGSRRSRFRGRKGVVGPWPATTPARNVANPLDQIDAVSKVSFETVPLLNASEYRYLPVLEAATRDFGDGHRLMAQTSLGELIRPSPGSADAAARDAAYRSINSKRLDFALIDRRGRLVAAIEYQGSGHHQGQAFMRDAVKREALRRAGVAFIEIEADMPPPRLREAMQRLLRPDAATGPRRSSA